ncbi:hypothetical protein V3C99_001076 [Haemonchus contortus]
MKLTIAAISLIGSSFGFLFPSSNSGCSCNTCAPQPVCPPLPTCPPVQSCPAPTPVCCDTCACNKKERKKRAIKERKEGVYVVDYEKIPTERTRAKRDVTDEVVKVDANCNSEDLRVIIIENIDRVTSVSKRRIQAECERILDGRYNVICARGDFSYITNTEEFCQQTVGDITCYVFKQLSDVVRARLS